MLRRRSHSSVGDAAPSDKELRRAVEVAGTIADHAALRPWRVIALRGEARERLGRAIAEASGATGHDADKLAQKPLRAPLLLAVVVSPKRSAKVPDWEQEAVASGVAHALSLLLDDAGWGVMWRTGHYTRSGAVHRMHELDPDERLLGWLYVGAKPSRKSGRRSTADAKRHLTSL
ncbi:nitroreductase [Protaetiibacter larvae]|uniref:Putative NAD(P)H nitroreductase n=2 Tax=Protaetiibacter larvae TaxID=2592654 RepID=A0A5C1YAA6_9MICO|nr:nitroreductase [Protaetiibacter larvae]